MLLWLCLTSLFGLLFAYLRGRLGRKRLKAVAAVLTVISAFMGCFQLVGDDGEEILRQEQQEPGKKPLLTF